MTDEIIKQDLGDESFPIEWASDAERGLFWVYDDLHCPQPLSPMYFDIGGWWLTCDHMFRRFGSPDRPSSWMIGTRRTMRDRSPPWGSTVGRCWSELLRRTQRRSGPSSTRRVLCPSSPHRG